MKVTEFFVGFGPRLWSFRKGETEYGVKAIPAGGYVRIIGMSNVEEIDPEDEPRTYRHAPLPRTSSRSILAGVTVNLLIAYILFFVVIVGNGEFKPGTSLDRVIKDSRRGDGRAEVRRQDRRDQRHADRRAGTTSATSVRPNAGEPDHDHGRAQRSAGRRSTATPEDVAGEGKLGVYPNTVRETYSVIEAVPQSFSWMGRATAGDRSAGWPRCSRRPASQQYGKTGDEPGREGVAQQRGAAPVGRRHRRPTAVTSSAAASGCCSSCSRRSTCSSRCST